MMQEKRGKRNKKRWDKHKPTKLVEEVDFENQKALKRKKRK